MKCSYKSGSALFRDSHDVQEAHCFDFTRQSTHLPMSLAITVTTPFTDENPVVAMFHDKKLQYLPLHFFDQIHHWPYYVTHRKQFALNRLQDLGTLMQYFVACR